MQSRENIIRDLEDIINPSPTVPFLSQNSERWSVVHVSEKLLHFGYSSRDFFSNRVHFADIIHAEDLERVAKDAVRFSQTDRNEFTRVFCIISKDDEIKLVDDRKGIIRNSKGEITYYQEIPYYLIKEGA